MKIRRVELPPAGQKVMVQCEGYRGLAYRNNNGIWKSVIGNQTLPAVMEFFQI
jgi:GH24 family phage-related lysozyme (muramidase)